MCIYIYIIYHNIIIHTHTHTHIHTYDMIYIDGMDELTAQPEVQGVCASCASVLQKRCQPRKVSGMNKDDLHTVVVQSQPSALPELLGYVSVRGNKMVQRAIAGDYNFFIFVFFLLVPASDSW